MNHIIRYSATVLGGRLTKREKQTLVFNALLGTDKFVDFDGARFDEICK